jgi:xanthine dehydrogenase accessory factor
MDSLDTQVLDAARKWASAGHRFALITVARTWGSAPRPPGAWMILRDDGQVQGSVSGGCIEDDLIRRAAAGEFVGSAPRLLRYGVTADEAHRFGLPCGGTLELVLEPAPDAALLEQLAQRIGTGQLVHRRVALATGAVTLEGGSAGDCQQWDGETLGHAARPGLAPADHRRRADFALSRDHGAGPRLSRLYLRPA